MEQLSESCIEFLKSNGVDKVVDIDSEEGQGVIREYLYAMGVHTTHPITQFDGERISIKIPLYGNISVEDSVVVSTPTPQSVQNIQNIQSIEKKQKEKEGTL